MTRCKKFDTKQEALDFMETAENVLDLQYKTVGVRHTGNTTEDVYAWVVTWDEPTFNELYPSRPIEL